MRSTGLTLVAALLAASVLVTSSDAQRRPAPKAKAPVKQKADPNAPVVLGTRQLPGEFGKFGTTYTIGKDLPLNFTLLSAEYRVDRFLGDDGGGVFGWMPRRDEKLLVVRYTVQNPNPRDARLWYGTFNIIGITGDDQNLNHLNRPIIGSNKRYQEVQLKPAQKVTQTAVIRVPAEGELPKLMIQHRFEPQAAVIRYDLRGKVAKLAADASDDGFTPKTNFEGKLDTFTPWPAADFKLISFEQNPSPLASLRSERGTTQWIARVGFRGRADQQARIWYGSFDFAVRTADGDLLQPRVQDRLLRMSSEQMFDGPIPIDEELNFRLIVDLPNGITPSEVRIAFKRPDEAFRPVVYKLGG